MISSANLPLFFIRLARILPLWLRSLLGWLIGYCFGLIPLRDQRFTKLQLQVILRLAPNLHLHLMAARVLANAGRCFLESLDLSALVSGRRISSRVSCDQRAYIEALISQRRPIVALTAHLGNWELLAAYMVQLGVPLTAIGKQLRSVQLQEALEFVRRQHGVETMWRSERSSARGILRALQQGRTVAALVDQDTNVSSSCLPFMGLPAATPVGLLELGQRANAIFVSAFIVRTGFLRFQIHVHELPSADPQSMLLEFNQRLENLIRANPTQWVWFHKRWRSPETGKRLSSKEYLSYLRKKLGEPQNSADTR